MNRLAFLAAPPTAAASVTSRPDGMDRLRIAAREGLRARIMRAMGPSMGILPPGAFEAILNAFDTGWEECEIAFLHGARP